MSITDLETYEGQVARLKPEVIETVGDLVREALNNGEDSEALDYQPGNGTSYRLLFLSSSLLRGGSVFRIPVAARWGVGDGQTLVAKCNWTASDWIYPFDLRPGAVTTWDYVQEVTGQGFADACAITALFREITAVER